MTDPNATKTGTLTLYGSSDSANLAVRMTLEELGLAYTFVETKQTEQQNRTADYLKLNPQGLLPVLVDTRQSRPLFETAGIMLYLADREGRLAPPTDSPDRGRLLTWLFFLANTLHSDMRVSFRPERYLAGGDVSDSFRNGLEQRIAAGMDHLETGYAESAGPYFFGQEPSIADIYAGMCARWYQIYPRLRVFEENRWPTLATMLRNLQERPAIRRSALAEGIGTDPFLPAHRPDVDETAFDPV